MIYIDHKVGTLSSQSVLIPIIHSFCLKLLNRVTFFFNPFPISRPSFLFHDSLNGISLSTRSALKSTKNK